MSISLALAAVNALVPHTNCVRVGWRGKSLSFAPPPVLGPGLH
jgi:hypothetical protein